MTQTPLDTLLTKPTETTASQEVPAAAVSAEAPAEEAAATTGGTGSPKSAIVPTLSTQVEVAGKAYELKGLTIAEGDEIYNALPADYQKLADSYANIALKFESAVKIELPANMTFDQAWKNYLAAPRDVGGKLSDTAAPYLKELAAQFDGIIPASSMGKAASDTTKFTGAAVDVLGDSIMFLPRVVGALGVAAGEAGHAAMPGISPEQAKAFGAAYAAAIYHEGSVRQAMQMFDSPFNKERSLFWSYPTEASLAGMEYAALNMPLIKDAWPFIAAAVKWVGGLVSHMGKDTPAPSFSEVLEGVKKEIAEKQTGDTSWRALTEAKLRGKEVKTAEGKIIAAEEIAGVKTKEIAETIADEKPFIDQDGNLNDTKKNGDGTVDAEEKLDADGKPVGRGDRIEEAAKGTLGKTGKNFMQDGEWGAEETGTVAGVAAVGLAATNKTVQKGAGAVVKAGGKAVVGTYKAAGQVAVATANTAISTTTMTASGVLQGEANRIDAAGMRQIDKLTDQVKDLTSVNAKNAKVVAEREAAIKAREAKITELEGKIKPGDKPGIFDKEYLSSEAKEQRKLADELAKEKKTLLKDQKALVKETKVLEGSKKVLTETTEELAEVTAKNAKLAKEGSLIQKTAKGAASNLGKGAEAIEGFGDKLMRGVQKGAGAMGIDVVETTARAAKFGKFAKLGGKAIPLVGYAFGAWEVFGDKKANADVVNGKKLNVWDQLEHDHKIGRVKDTEYYAMRGLQAAYLGTSGLSLVGMGASQLTLTGLENLSPDHIKRYLPDSLIADGMKMLEGAKDQKALEGLHKAAVDAGPSGKKLAMNGTTVTTKMGATKQDEAEMPVTAGYNSNEMKLSLRV